MILRYVPPYSPGGWVQTNVDGFGNPGDGAVATLDGFGPWLYAATWAGKVWRAPNGRTWTEVTPSWLSPESVTVDAEVFGSHLYLGVGSQNAAEVWRTDGTIWEQVAEGGFGDPANGAVNALRAFSGMLYAATSNSGTGTQIWRSPTGDAGDWSRVYDGGPTDTDVALDTYAGALYAGWSRDGVAELWRSSNGTTWTPSFSDGLAPNNTHVSALAEFGGQFYAALRNVVTGGEVWRSSDGTSWEPVVTGGLGTPENGRPYGLIALGGRLYLVFCNQATGAEVWHSADGGAWKQEVGAGWGDANNAMADYFDKGAAVFQNHLYIGTLNWATGGEVWMKVMNEIYLPLVMRNH